MAVYRVPLTTWANTTVDVTTDSENPEEIVRLAEQQVFVQVCSNCASDVDLGDGWTAAEFEGETPFTKLSD